MSRSGPDEPTKHLDVIMPCITISLTDDDILVGLMIITIFNSQQLIPHL